MASQMVELNKKTYDSLAKQYEEKVLERKNFNEQVISKLVPYIKSGNKVLDIGCAVGLDLAIFLEKGFNVTGIELSKEMAQFAQKRNPTVPIIIGNFMEMPLSNTYDAIFAQAFIHLFPKKESKKVLSKINDLLVKGGVAQITTSKSTESKEGLFTKIDYEGNHQRFRKYWTTTELKESILEAGFKIEQYYETTDSYNKEWMVFIVRK